MKMNCLFFFLWQYFPARFYEQYLHCKYIGMFNEKLKNVLSFSLFAFLLFIYNVETMKWKTIQSLHVTSAISLNVLFVYLFVFLLLKKLIRSPGNLTLKWSFALTLLNLLFPCSIRGSRGGCYGDSLTAQ